MPLLFSYGTLREEEVQLALFGRRLEGRRDRLPGYEQVTVRLADAEFARTSGSAHHAILRPVREQGAEVAGTAFDVTDAELELADAYEPVEYRRVQARLASGRRAWVYVDARSGGEPGPDA